MERERLLHLVGKKGVDHRIGFSGAILATTEITP